MLSFYTTLCSDTNTELRKAIIHVYSLKKKVIVKQVLVFSHWARLLAYHLSSHFHYFISVSFDTCDQVRLVFLVLGSCLFEGVCI